MENNSEKQTPLLTIIVFVTLATFLNLGIGFLVKALSLPLYLDSIGTILTTILLGWKRGAIVGVLGFFFTSISYNPFAIYFIGTQVVIALYVDFVGKRGWFSNIFKSIFSGVGLGIVAAIVSAPVIIWVFGGATGNGSALVTSFFIKMGKQIAESVILSGVSVEPLDKGLQCILAFLVLKKVPKNLLEKYTGGSLLQNKFI